ncbi:hypothetical protein [Vibrio parahaemolyticus]|uniref:hypothetical protein n=1 Tax=Vibrio parahaemolyticus TaxID=670 RepID=UPI0025B04573|nr:hypothetical protein [Vibrio parahaemolyticus]MDN2653530.1 hypothetical protein [Vibrio parahaemolyticus]
MDGISQPKNEFYNEKNITIFFFIYSSIAYSAGIGEFKLKEIRAEKGSVYLIPKTTIQNPLNCSNGQVVKLSPDTPSFEQMYSQALTAVASGKRIRVWATQCSSSPWGSTVPKAVVLGLLAD